MFAQKYPNFFSSFEIDLDPSTGKKEFMFDVLHSELPFRSALAQYFSWAEAIESQDSRCLVFISRRNSELFNICKLRRIIIRLP